MKQSEPTNSAFAIPSWVKPAASMINGIASTLRAFNLAGRFTTRVEIDLAKTTFGFDIQQVANDFTENFGRAVTPKNIADILNSAGITKSDNGDLTFKNNNATAIGNLVFGVLLTSGGEDRTIMFTMKEEGYTMRHATISQKQFSALQNLIAKCIIGKDGNKILKFVAPRT